MTIQEFHLHTGVPLRTLRYYVTLGLLCPTAVKGRLVFDEGCQRDLARIQQLKDCGLTIREIGQWLSGEREDVTGCATGSTFRRELLLRKREETTRELEALLADISRLEQRAAQNHRTALTPLRGCPLSMVELLCCPRCGLPLEYRDIHMAQNSILSGSGHCSCGYRLEFREGIVVVLTRTPAAGGHISPVDHHRETYSRMHPTEVSGLQKSFNWIFSRLQAIQPQGKVMLETSVGVTSLLSTGAPLLDGQTRCIIADADYAVIADMKQRIEALAPTQAVLYLVDDSLCYPLRPHCVDILLDYYTSEIMQLFSISSLPESIHHLLAPGAEVLGIYTYVAQGGRTFRRNRELFPASHPGRYRLPEFQESLRRCGLSPVEEHIISTFNFTTSLPAFQKGDLLGDYAFHFRLSQKARLDQL